MPSLSIDNLEINYEISGEGPLLILHHGFGSWGKDWHVGGWIYAFEPSFSVLAFDAVGHGKSTRSHDPVDQTIERRADVVRALADSQSAEKFAFLGFSLGGRTGFELAASSPERITALAIGGMQMLPPSVEQQKYERRIRVLRSGRAKSIEQPVGERPGNDPKALAASHEALIQWQGVDGRLGDFSAPTMLFCGDKDPYFENAESSSREFGFQFEKLEGVDHDAAFFESKLAVEKTVRFFESHLVS